MRLLIWPGRVRLLYDVIYFKLYFRWGGHVRPLRISGTPSPWGHSSRTLCSWPAAMDQPQERFNLDETSFLLSMNLSNNILSNITMSVKMFDRIKMWLIWTLSKLLKYKDNQDCFCEEDCIKMWRKTLFWGQSTIKENPNHVSISKMKRKKVMAKLFSSVITLDLSLTNWWIISS